MNSESNGVKVWQWVVGVIILILVVVLGIYLFSGSSSAPQAVTTPTETETTPTSTVSANNGIVIADQFPGNIVYVSSVQLAAPGFVVIMANNAGKPGAVIGSKAFPKGINPGQINLTKSMVDGGVYYAALFSDTAGTGVYSASADKAVVDAKGTPIMKIFHASSNIPETKG